MWAIQAPVCWSTALIYSSHNIQKDLQGLFCLNSALRIKQSLQCLRAACPSYLTLALSPSRSPLCPSFPGQVPITGTLHTSVLLPGMPSSRFHLYLANFHLSFGPLGVEKLKLPERSLLWPIEIVLPLFFFHGTVSFSVQFSLSVVSDSATPWIAARQASLSITISWSSLRLTSIESMMPYAYKWNICDVYILYF